MDRMNKEKAELLCSILNDAQDRRELVKEAMANSDVFTNLSVDQFHMVEKAVKKGFFSGKSGWFGFISDEEFDDLIADLANEAAETFQETVVPGLKRSSFMYGAIFGLSLTAGYLVFDKLRNGKKRQKEKKHE